MIGTNFGAPLAYQYAGRNAKFAYDNFLFYPYNSTSLSWWDVAQYLTCFSGISSAENTTSSSNSTSSASRICDLGVVLSDHIAFYNSWSVDNSLQQLIVQSPTVQGGPGAGTVYEKIKSNSSVDANGITLRQVLYKL